MNHQSYLWPSLTPVDGGGYLGGLAVHGQTITVWPDGQARYYDPGTILMSRSPEGEWTEDVQTDVCDWAEVVTTPPEGVEEAVRGLLANYKKDENESD
jgi:hypothetical protein